jgi:hypothetical protein
MAKITMAMAEKWLGDVPQEKQFWCRDGRVLNNLPELEAALKLMTEETFQYHSNETKSDFSKWVKDVIGDEELAKYLQKSTTRVQAAKSVVDRVTWLNNKAVTG